MIEFKEKVLDKDVVVHCTSEEQANNLLKWADSGGCVWGTGGSLVRNNCYSRYKKDTCYDIRRATCRLSPVEYFTNRSYTIIPYAEAVLGEELKRGDLLFVSDVSVEEALQDKKERIFLADVGGKSPFICVNSGEDELYPAGKYRTSEWEYAAPIPKSSVPEMTMEEVVEKIGYNFKLVK